MREWQLEQLQNLFEFGEKSFYPDMNEGFPIIHVGEDFSAMLGYTPSELMIHCRNRADELILQESFQNYCQEVLEGIEKEGHYTCCYPMRHRNGERIWLRENGKLVTGEPEPGHEPVSYVQAVVVNVTREENIRQERDTVYDNIPGGVFTMLVTDTNFYIVDSNRRNLEMLGTTREEYLGSSGMYTFPEDLPGLRSCIVQNAAKRESIDYEFRSYAGRKKEFHWFRMICGYYKDTEDGVEYLGILSDITDRRNMLFQLETEKERYRLAAELMSSFLFDYSVTAGQMRIYIQNEKSEYIPNIRKFSTGPIGKLIREGVVVHKDDCLALEQLFLSPDNGKIKVRLLVENRKTKEKVYAWHEMEMRKIYQDKKIIRVVGSAKNIQEQQEMEVANKDLRQIYESQIEKVFEMFLRVRISDGRMKIYPFGSIEMQPEFYTNSFSEFIMAFSENYVHPDEKEQFFVAMQLSHMKDILDISKTEESLFFRIRRKDSEYRYKCLRYSYLDSEQNEIILSVQDVQYVREEQNRREEANYRVLMESLDDVQSVMEMRRNFFSLIARELYSPLNYAQSVMTRGASPDPDKIRAALVYMSNVVQNIAEYEKLEQGKVRLENHKFILDQALAKNVNLWRIWAQSSDISLQYNVNLNSRYYYGDEKRLMQILDHVVGNSISASEEKSRVEIWVSDQGQGIGINRIAFTVEDHGVPVSNDFFGRMYPPEARNNEKVWAHASEHGGTAFSLIVARELVQLMGGTIDLQRKGDDLNVIRIDLPLQIEGEDAADVKIENPQSEGEPNVLHGFSILLVRNNRVEHSTPAAKLQVSGAHVDLASGGMDAVQIIRSYPENELDAILVEANLGDMDYLEFTELLRQWEQGAPPIPIIAVVEEVSPETIQEGMRMGVNAWINDLNDLERLATVLTALKIEDQRN